MGTNMTITKYFGGNLAKMLSDKIITVYRDFDSLGYINAVENKCVGLSYSIRVELHADELYKFLPKDFYLASDILASILGPENPNETGMFSTYYWIMPIGKYVEKYGIDNFDRAMDLIEEITKRNTGEYAIRPYIRKYPDRTLDRMTFWAKSDNFHLRRLASEGLRPKLPWASKLDIFIDNPKPVFEILEILKEDEIMFVKKSVANHLTDWLKVNKDSAAKLIKRWQKSENIHTKWIIKRATRKISID